MGAKKKDLGQSKKPNDIREDFFNSLMDELGVSEQSGASEESQSSYEGTTSGPSGSSIVGQESKSIEAFGFSKDSKSELVGDDSIWGGAQSQKRDAQEGPHLKSDELDLKNIPERPPHPEMSHVSSMPEYKPSNELPFEFSPTPPKKAQAASELRNEKKLPDDDSTSLSQSVIESDETIAVGGGQNQGQRTQLTKNFTPEIRVVGGQNRFGKQGATPSAQYLNSESSLLQAEALKIAQQRIRDLEKEVERLRIDNDEIAAAAAVMRSRLEDAELKLSQADSHRMSEIDALNAEIDRLRKHAEKKEFDGKRFKTQAEQLEARLKSDYKKIRTRERELENRLDLARAEKQALVKTKDEHILELRRRIEVLQSESSGFRNKVLELNRTLGANNEQFKRTVRALRLALGNLEGFQGDAPVSSTKKKAE
jgi:predicted  nucleic acid-binding Zn-ribbon protein